ncbi:MAG: formate dehydrogenase accessory sulfurtransferase FdhD [Bacteroidetes bacterium]|nr:formate dehydrogenase accessory sulfurtransferase FdhD [Bacteroidota bacterium]
MNHQTEAIHIHRISNGRKEWVPDMLAIEEPLEIQLQYSSDTGKMKKSIAVTMRTPGNDEELAAGFLFTEGIISGHGDIEKINRHSTDQNKILVTLVENIKPRLQQAARNFYTTSSCGVCGKASIEAVQVNIPQRIKKELRVTGTMLYALPNLLREHQEAFEHTGGIHASALFDVAGNLISLREDVGRHNALDKLAGSCLLKNTLPLDQHLLLLSGRASFELIQKAAVAGIQVVAAVGAPSSLAVDMAKEHDITLVGFLKPGRFNVYNGIERIITESGVG